MSIALILERLKKNLSLVWTYNEFQVIMSYRIFKNTNNKSHKAINKI